VAHADARDGQLRAGCLTLILDHLAVLDDEYDPILGVEDLRIAERVAVERHQVCAFAHLDSSQLAEDAKMPAFALVLPDRKPGISRLP
jgi:hypothetical protein